YKCAIDANHDVIQVDTQSAKKGFQLADGRRLPDIEEAEEGERGEVALPVERACASERDPLAEDFVYDDDLRIFEFLDFGGDGSGLRGGDEEERGEGCEMPGGKAGVLVKQDSNGEGGHRAGGAGRDGGVAAAEPCGEREGELSGHKKKSII